MNDRFFEVEARLSIYAEIRPPYLPVLSYTMEQTQKYKCWKAKYKYQCHFGNSKPKDEPVEVKNTNISKFELHEVAVDDDYTNGEDPKSSALYSLHLGNLFVVAKVPTLNFSIWYDKNNSDPWRP